jgi:2-haloalkanoic acid dehalogenase type II
LNLANFSVLSFDCYDTLIDWESGIWDALEALRARAGAAVGMGLARTEVELTREDALRAFARLESREQEKTPGLSYPEVLSAVHGQLAAEWDVAPDPEADSAFGRSIGDWPAFPDTVEALRYLRQHYRLVVLSNVDRAGFAATLPRLGVAFDAVYTAQDIGSYKPDVRNFRYLLERLRGNCSSPAQAAL